MQCLLSKFFARESRVYKLIYLASELGGKDQSLKVDMAERVKLSSERTSIVSPNVARYKLMLKLSTQLGSCRTETPQD